MKADRSSSQILHGFLPSQTVDLNGGIWKVVEWRTPHYMRVDTDSLRRELIRLAGPWEAAGTDRGITKRLRAGAKIEVVSLDRRNGVLVERFPDVWQCRTCNRVVTSRTRPCRCGAQSWGQLHFVGYHSCGELTAPWIPRCKRHDDVKIVFPGSADASQIKFVCPECSSLLRQGFGFSQCDCGAGTRSYNVHRAASVFTPRSVAIVNPMSPDKVEELRSADGSRRALAWVLEGMPRGGLGAVLVDQTSLERDLIAKGIEPELAARMAAMAAAEGAVAVDDVTERLGANSERALEQAVTVASAMAESRRTLEDLIDGSDERSPLGQRYRNLYPLAVHRAGLDGLDLVDQFPILSGNFAYTRGDSAPGQSTLRFFQHGRTGNVMVYADLQETEAYFVRLDPTRVAKWLELRGFALGSWKTPSDARRAILEKAAIPRPGDEPADSTIGSDLLALVHSYAHRLIRQTAVLAGLDRNSLAELLVPEHLGFFVYAAARGDFVLGGLQALYETELDRVLDTLSRGEHRCALDPACTTEGAACVACLHLGEPSCRYFNRFLDRRHLFGKVGYLTTSL